jgi:hypothetical protein
MNNMLKQNPFTPINLLLSQVQTYLFAFIFIFGNLILPQLTHRIPNGGLIFLPIYFFTLIGAYKFGLTVGLTTAILSPLVNNLLFGMPPTFVLPIILIKSCLIAIVASLVASKFKTISLLNLLIIVSTYQFLGSIIELVITGSYEKAIQDIKLGLPGILIQIFLGYHILNKMSNYDIKRF